MPFQEVPNLLPCHVSAANIGEQNGCCEFPVFETSHASRSIFTRSCFDSVGSSICCVIFFWGTLVHHLGVLFHQTSKAGKKTLLTRCFLQALSQTNEFFAPESVWSTLMAHGFFSVTCPVWSTFPVEVRLMVQKSGYITSWYGKYPYFYRVLYIPGAGFLPSTVC